MTDEAPPAVTMVTLDAATAALVRLAAAIALGGADTIRERSGEALAAGTPALWIDELLLQSVLMVGYPRALGAAKIWREVRGAEAEWEEDGGDQRLAPAWAIRGEALCRTIYGDNYRRLRDNVRALHPALDAWMVAEGYGRTLGRPGLDLVRRELGVIAQVAVLGALPQLHSHLRGALNAGAVRSVVGEALALALRDAAPENRAPAQALWERVRP